MTTDNRIVWKDKNDLELMIEISKYIEKYDIKSVKEYQSFKKEYFRKVPSLWFIQEHFGSWESLLKKIGNKTYNRYRWSMISDEELIGIVKSFVSENKVFAQRRYEKVSSGKNLPSLSTLKKRFDNIQFLFEPQKNSEVVTDFELLSRLKEEIIRLGMEENLSMTEFRKQYDRELLPSVDTIMRNTNKTWEELMEEIGFKYREIKLKKQLGNLK